MGYASEEKATSLVGEDGLSIKHRSGVLGEPEGMASEIGIDCGLSDPPEKV